MKAREEFHHEAMALADRGDAARAQKKPDEARAFFAQAFALEKQALALAPPGLQPTYSVLLRSAACLALEAELADEALTLIEIGLASPLTPGPLHEELEEIFKSLLGEPASAVPVGDVFESPVDRGLQQGARLLPRAALREVA